MKPTSTYLFRSGLALFFLATGVVLAQDQQPPQPPQQNPPTGGWRRAGDAPPAQSPEPAGRTDAYGQPVGQPAEPPQDAPPQIPQGPPQVPQASQRPAYGLPAQLTLKPGTFVSIRTTETLSSNHNHEGDIFTATLAQPIIVDGVVVAQRGQTVMGRVAEAKKVDGVHRLGLELTGLTLADGTQAPVQSKLVTTQGRTTPTGQQVGTVAATTAVGAGVGAAAAWGTGAAIGGGVGLVAGLAGVLATRNHPTVLYPETPLTFQVTSPVTVATSNAPQAFRYAGPEDFQRPQQRTGPGMRLIAPAPYYSPYYYGYGPGYYPYWGPSFGIGFGGGFYGGFRGGGFRGRFR